MRSSAGEYSEEAREQAGLTHSAVAARLGATESYVARCESRGRRVDLFELKAFAEVYGKPISYFLYSKRE